jgi:HPt (histidine-containing phosphotransfer) domain-containing protein
VPMTPATGSAPSGTPEAGEQSADGAARPPVFDRAALEALRELLGDDRELLTGIVSLFVSETDERLTAIRAAAASDDGDALRSAAHALKGSAAALGAAGLAALSADLEQLGSDGRTEAARARLGELDAAFTGAREALQVEVAERVA